MTEQVYIGLGSNMAEPLLQLQHAVAALAKLAETHLLQVSSIYQSRPMGPSDQDDYLNAAAELETALAPLELLDSLQAIEKRQGRQRDGKRWQQRPIDLDILLYGEQSIHSERLVVPHPGMHERAFVLVPLQELSEDIDIPGQGRLKPLLEGAMVGEVVQRLEQKLWPM